MQEMKNYEALMSAVSELIKKHPEVAQEFDAILLEADRKITGKFRANMVRPLGSFERRINALQGLNLFSTSVCPRSAEV